MVYIYFTFAQVAWDFGKINYWFPLIAPYCLSKSTLLTHIAHPSR